MLPKYLVKFGNFNLIKFLRSLDWVSLRYFYKLLADKECKARFVFLLILSVVTGDVLAIKFSSSPK